MIQRPTPAEHAAYFQKYIDLVPDGDFMEVFGENLRQFAGFFHQIPADKIDFSYAEGKWTIKEVVMHLIDTERIMAYRAMTFLRNDLCNLPSCDEDLYAANADVTNRSLESLITEFSLLRQSHFYLFQNISDAAAQRVGTVNNRSISPQALAYIMIGHVLHHIKIVEERYL